MIHVRRPHRIIAALNIAVVGGEIEWRPPTVVRDVGIGAVLHQIRRQFVMPVLRSGEQWSPSVKGPLVDISAGFDQNPGAFQTVFASRQYQGCQAAAIFGSRRAEEQRDFFGRRPGFSVRDSARAAGCWRTWSRTARTPGCAASASLADRAKAGVQSLGYGIRK